MIPDQHGGNQPINEVPSSPNTAETENETEDQDASNSKPDVAVQDRKNPVLGDLNKSGPETAADGYADDSADTYADTEKYESGSNAHETGEMVGEIAKDLWEDAKDFSRGFWKEFNKKD